MSTSRHYEPISYTARKILQKRALYTDIPLAKEMAEAAGVRWRVSPFRAWLRRLVWGDVRSGYYLQLRHDAISSALEGFPGCPVLEIGAGFGTRGLSEAVDREAYVESDLPELIAWKRGLVEVMRDGRAPSNHHFLQLNACNSEDVGQALGFLGGLDLSMPLVVLNEGVLVYFDAEEKRTFRDHVRRLLESHPAGGVWITPDLSERDLDSGAAQRWLARSLRRKVRRTLSRFRSDEAAAEFLTEGGLVGSKQPAPHSSHPDSAVRAISEVFRAWVIRVRARSDEGE